MNLDFEVTDAPSALYLEKVKRSSTGFKTGLNYLDYRGLEDFGVPVKDEDILQSIKRGECGYIPVNFEGFQLEAILDHDI